MTAQDLTEISTALGITLPEEYCELILERQDELKAAYKKPLNLDWELYLRTKNILLVNQSERQKDAGVGYAFPNWWLTYFLIGTDGAGNYCAIRIDGQAGVWVIGSDCGDEAEKIFESLSELIDATVAE